MSMASVAVAETHTAVVIFFGDRAYKVKKPVVMDFLDFRTVAARRAACEQEVALNRRLAPDVYLGVAELSDPAGADPEALVVMRRMPAARRLSHLVQSGAPVDDHLRRLAHLLCVFHESPATDPTVAGIGEPGQVRRNWEANTQELRRFTNVLDRESVAEVGRLAGRYVDGRGPLFRERLAAGLIRDGHGDLLADDIFCLDDGPRVLDCIEFDDRLRHGDVLADLAFLAMDLERLGAEEEASAFLRWYEELSGRPQPRSLVDHYIAYRAQVRSKVSCLRHEQGGAGEDRAARALLALSRAHLEQARVRLVLVGGLPGTGKSTVARGLGDDLGWLVLSSDEVRKELAGLDTTTPAPAPWREGLYSAAHTRATYREVLRRAGEAVVRGTTVIVDASWSDRYWRERAAVLADTTASDLVALHCTAPAEVRETRVRRRSATGPTPSDATVPVARAIAERWDPWPGALELSTDRSPQQVHRAAVEAACRAEP